MQPKGERQINFLDARPSCSLVNYPDDTLSHTHQSHITGMEVYSAFTLGTSVWKYSDLRTYCTRGEMAPIM